MTQRYQFRPIFLSILKFAVACGLLFTVAIAAYVKFIIIPELPDTQSLTNIQFQTPLSVFSEDGLLIAKFGEKKRIPISYADIPTLQVNAFLAAEDKDFFNHNGVDFMGLMRAATQLILTGKKKQGGSTITMQVARNFFLSNEKTYLRKLREILLSFVIEQQLSKQEILSLYLNKIYLGHRSYGIAAAADVYYGKKLAELTLAQKAMIAGLPKAPSAFNPITNPERAIVRRDYVLHRLYDLNYIQQDQLESALAEPISANLQAASYELEASYVAEMVRDELYKTYGEDTYTTGMQVYTTINARQQKAATTAVRDGLHQYDKRHGYRGVLGRIDLSNLESNSPGAALLAAYENIGETVPAVVISLAEKSITVLNKNDHFIDIAWDDLKWAWPYINENRQGKEPKQAADILSAGDIIRIRQKPGGPSFELAQVPSVSGSLVAINPSNGALAALVGGYAFSVSKFNLAYQAKRQPGSGFKPFLYSAALSKGYTTATLINDAPVVFDDAGLEQQWRPENYSGKFFGPTRLREALTHSRNLVSIRVLRDVGVNYVRNFAVQFGFDPADLPKNLSLSLGSGSSNPYQMATAYSVFANGGFRVKPFFIDRVLSYSGEVLFQAKPLVAPSNNKAARTPSLQSHALIENSPITTTAGLDATEAETYAKAIISPQLNFIVNSLLRDVVKHGTGRRALSLGRTDLAGKTGTTNDQRDAWFNGFHPSLVAVSWVGFDNSQPLGGRETGGKAALPIWMAFMKETLKGVPHVELSQPDGIVGMLIDPDNGFKTGPANPKAIIEYFREENLASIETASPISTSIQSDPQQTIEALF
ncbi:MAG: penicillin-binding protein 1A [Cycloclasticus sp.]|nr:penicillin-binding protein 1A [Cycloclasticus sp.]MBQ0789856.1 penicillin-binding protein 1A [Cycloclasticus sp.]